MTQIHVKFQKGPLNTIGGVAQTKYTLSTVYTLVVYEPDKFKMRLKKYSEDISKPHAILPTRKQIHVKFQKDPLNTIGGVAQTRYSPFYVSYVVDVFLGPETSVDAFW